MHVTGLTQTQSASPPSSFLERAWRVAFSIHHWAGLLTGILIFITAASGFVLVFTEDLNLRRHPQLEATANSQTVAPLGPVLAQAAERHPGYAIASVRPGHSTEFAWIVFLRHLETDHRIVVDFDPRSGAIIGERDFADTPFRFLLDLHYTYFAGTVGKLLSTAVSLALVVLAMTGFWIYRGAIRDLFRWRISRVTGTRGAITWLHKWTGLWALVLALIWGVTGFFLMLVILPLTFTPAKRGLAAADPAQLRQLADTSVMQQLAASRIPGGEVFSIIPPATGGKSVRFVYLLRQEWPWSKRAEAVFDASTGALQRVILPRDQSAAQRFDFAVTALHYGFYGSRGTLMVYAIGALAVGFLPLSGYMIWWLKRRA